MFRGGKGSLPFHPVPSGVYKAMQCHFLYKKQEREEGMVKGETALFGFMFFIIIFIFTGIAGSIDTYMH